ncbi:flavin reductase family protein [Acidovorax sp. NCPPB 4044]|uniref:flavin reductase family protein n=1 Tax=Acidovorax sp. NCPPB 4044 TaxID=2940490 RepID=UPI002303A540|nr:flavin reductase family protein [Acidovorax sp. NCPPB 4044]MDA8520836.1 flavin reductase family protein [Acidovorax sp. NCPPB 4044]
MAAAAPAPRRRTPRWTECPLAEVRRYLEPGPVVLVGSAWKGRADLMAMGWHTVMEFTPSLLGCVISRANHSHGLVRRSRECTINIPEAHWVDAVVGVGNCSGAEVDKFERFGFTAEPAREVGAPLVGECFVQIECRVVDTRLVNRYDFFVLEAVRARVDRSVRRPQTLHYRGGGEFMLSGPHIGRRALFAPGML